MDNVMEGDSANPDVESRKSHIRPSDDDQAEPEVPNKVMKLVEEGLANQDEDPEFDAGGINENDSDVDLGEEDEEYEDAPDQNMVQKYAEGEEDAERLDLEADYVSDQPGGEFDEEFEEGDTYDEDEDEPGTTADETEDNVQEEADSSTELDFVQTNLAYIEDCQSDIDTLNHKANEEILLVELKYNKLRLPVYKRRNTHISRVPHFWATVFSQHRQLRHVLTKEDIKCLKHVTRLQVEDFEDNRSGYSIQFYFSENPWFESKVITKEYHLPWHGSPSCSCTPIQWKKGMNLTLKSSSFFSWFTSQEDASADDIAEIIKDDLWPNPLQCFLMSKQPEESEDEEEADDSGNLNAKDDSVVLLDDTPDDDVEYISSEEEEEQEWQGEKVRGKTAQYLVQEEEGDDDEEYEEFDDDDVDVTGSSGIQQQQQPQAKVQERRPKSGDVISIDDEYLGSEEEDESEYFDGTVDLDGEDKLLQGQMENEDEFEEAESSKDRGDFPNAEDRLSGEIEPQQADTSNEQNEDSRHSNGVVGSSTNEVDDPRQTDNPNQNELDNNTAAAAAKTKMQEQSKVVSTSSTGDSDVTAGAT